MNLGRVNHSGRLNANNSSYDPIASKEMQYIHFIVKNAIDGQELGVQKIEMDELIDPNLEDLAKEYCVGISRQRYLETLTE